MKIRKWIIYGGVFFIAISTVLAVLGSRWSFRAFDDGGGDLSFDNPEECGYAETVLEVLNQWQRNGIMNICQEVIFLSRVEDTVSTYGQNPANQANLNALVMAVNSLLENPAYVQAARENNSEEMRRLERAALMPIYPQLEGFINQLVQAFRDSGGREIGFNRGPGRLLMPRKTSAISVLAADRLAQGRSIEEVFPELERGYKKNRDWEKIKGADGWERGDPCIGIPGWKGFRNPKYFPGWEFGGGDMPGELGKGGYIKPPGSDCWGVAVGLDRSNNPWIGVGAGNGNGGVVIGIGGGGIIFGGGIRF